MDHKLSLILVDDDETLLTMLKDYLSEEGHSCRTFTTAEATLAGLRSSPADVLVTDVAMPGMPGLELTREAKRMRPGMNIIVMTGFVDDFSYDQAIEAGASDFIKKPFTIQELLMRIKHVKMQEKLREISITDELTGLLNRRGFFTFAEKQMKVAARLKSDMTLLFADVDAFKAINDTWGHQQGDDALAALAGIFRNTFRESDIIARMSGDEFAILLIDTPEKNLSLISKRLERKLQAFNEGGGAPYSLSLSIGLVVYDYERPCSIDRLLKKADDLMYKEKQRKKNGEGGKTPLPGQTGEGERAG